MCDRGARRGWPRIGLRVDFDHCGRSSPDSIVGGRRTLSPELAGQREGADLPPMRPICQNPAPVREGAVGFRYTQEPVHPRRQPEALKLLQETFWARS